MDPARQYSVMTTGTLEPGFDGDQVAADFATLWGSPLDTAQTFIHAEKCVASDVDEERAEHYKTSLTAIGLQVVVVPCDRQDATNDEDSGQEPDRFASDAIESDSTAYTWPSAPTTSDSLVVDLRPPESYECELDQDRGRVFRLAILGIAAGALLAGTMYMTRHQVTATVVTGLTGPTSFVKVAKASEEVNALLDVSGMNAEFVRFTASVAETFREFFEPIVEQDPAIASTDLKRLLRLVPKAYNSDALQTSVANRLNQMSYASDILVLREIYESPVVQSYVRKTASRNVLNDRADFERFKAELENKPLSSARLTAVSAIVDAMGLNKAALDIKLDLNRNLIVTGGNLRPGYDTPEAKQRMKDDIELMREQVEAESNQIRLELIAQLAWQYEDANIAELHALHTAIDRSLVRTFIRETTTAYEAFIREATLWLHRELDIN